MGNVLANAVSMLTISACPLLHVITTNCSTETALFIVTISVKEKGANLNAISTKISALNQQSIITAMFVGNRFIEKVNNLSVITGITREFLYFCNNNVV